VVFFCGAGISKPAGLPGFFELTKKITAKLGVARDSKIGVLMSSAFDQDDPELAPPLDQIFSLLQKEYTRDRIEREVTTLLKTPKGANVAAHETVLRLSSDLDGTPFLVTTNFDLLFERARRRLKVWSPPALPSLVGDYLPRGIVYLHGRLSTLAVDQKISPLVLGSADFGRAYLADGWATNFIRQLLERRVVVLLGYSANDPPIRYLLEGLNSSTSTKLRAIYAFDRGSESDVSAKWRDLGVIAIPFNEFGQLWESLDLWASRAKDPADWKKYVLSLAQNSPRQLQPFQRGQVVALAATDEGAKAFADESPPPTSEWLCVFDKFVRYGKPSREGWKPDAPEIDPQAEYGLDDDPPRPDPGDTRSEITGIDLIGSLSGDTGTNTFSRLSGPASTRQPASRRLWWLSRWFEKVSHEQAAIWWAGRQFGLHPDILWGINRRLTGHGEPFDDKSWLVWSRLYEINDTRTDDVHDLGWYDFQAFLKRGGWSASTLRHFKKAISPRLTVETPSLRVPIPSISNPDFDPDNLLQFKVHSPSRHGEKIEIPDEVLPTVFRIVRESLEESINLLAETKYQAEFFHLPAIEPDERPGGRFGSHDGLAATFRWSVELFERLCDRFPEAAKLETSIWPAPDRYFFDKFRVFAWKNNAIFSGTEAAGGILSLSQESLWNGYLQREVLHLLKARWVDLSPAEQALVEERVLAGRERYSSESQEDYENRNTILVGARLGWLEKNGCKLTSKAQDFLNTCRNRSDWNTVWETTADHDMDPRSGFVERRKDAGDLGAVPLGQIISNAHERSVKDRDNFVEFVPFEGLVRERPLRALSSLSLEGRTKKFPIRYWQQLLSEWPEGCSERLILLCGKRLANLPPEVLFELRFYAPSWIEKNLPNIVSRYPHQFLAVWDSIFDKLVSLGDEATKSSIGETRIGDRIVEKSRKTVGHAINAPIGNLVEALFASLGERKFQPGERFSKDFTQRLEKSLMAAGEGAYHAAGLLARRLPFVFSVDPSWCIDAVIPTLDITNPLAQAAWSGALSEGAVPQSAELFDLIRGDFLAIFETHRDWLEEDENLEQRAVQFLIIATFWNKNDKRYVSDRDCQKVLRLVSDSARQAALWIVSEIVEKHNSWSSFGKRFFTGIWPQEARFQTGSTSDAMIRIAENVPDRFPEIIAVIGGFIRPADHPDLFIYRQRRKGTAGDRASLVQRWPLQVLQVLDRIISIEPRYVPHDLGALLAEIVEHAPETRSLGSWRRLNELISK
jgi:hypothetical protein